MAELLGAAEALDEGADELGAIDSAVWDPDEQAVRPTVATAITPSAAANLRFMRFMTFSLSGVDRGLRTFPIPLVGAGCHEAFGAGGETDWKLLKKVLAP